MTQNKQYLEQHRNSGRVWANCFLCDYKTDEINNISDFDFKGM